MSRTSAYAAGLAVAVAALSGCGDDDSSGVASAPTSATPVTSSPGALDATVVAILSETAAGGSTAATATRVDRPGRLAAFVHQFRGPMASEVRRAAAVGRGSGAPTYAQVIAIGCDTPPGATVRRTDQGVVIEAGEVASPRPECYAAVTSVAVVTVP